MKILRSAPPVLMVIAALACGGESPVTEAPEIPAQPQPVDSPTESAVSPETSLESHSAVTSETESAEMAEGETTSPAVDVPLALRAYSNRTQYVLGEPVQLFIEFHNLTDQEVQTRAILFLDHGLSVHITPVGGERWRFIDRFHRGITVPTAGPIRAHSSRGGMGERPKRIRQPAPRSASHWAVSRPRAPKAPVTR